MTICLFFWLFWQDTNLSDPVMVDRVALKVNDKIITERELLHTYSQRKKELVSNYQGEDIQAALEDAWKQTMDDAVDQLLLFEKAVEIGVAISEDALESRLQSVKEANGFSDEEFEKILREQTNMSIDEYLDYSRRDESAKRVIQSQVLSKIDIEDSEIAKYYEENQSEFMEPATYRISEIVAIKGENPSVAKFKIASSLEQIRNGAEFADVASTQSDSNSREYGGDLGTVLYGDLNQDIESAVKALSVGQVSEIIETDTAFFIIKVTAKTQAKPKGIDEVKEEIRYRLQEPRLQTKLEAFLKDLRASYLVDRMITKPASGY
ncbi:MAG: peptidyl-prolyl cis-trans isomerase [Acidobacteria bacterium]|nr:peptidyl-prolyl cis-trans isomerase [Acidobacteriota bacterium]MCB9396882.1 peptidyl-prolyl cis-trans isomerase [Acidobacteriota bacterium]